MSSKSNEAILLIGSSLECPDIEYASRFRATDPIIFLKKAGVQVLVVSRLEYNRACRQSAPRSGSGSGEIIIESPETLNITACKKNRLGVLAEAVLRKYGVKKAHVSSAFPFGPAQYLASRGVRLVEAREPVFPGRAVKTPEEVSMIQQCQMAAVIAVRAAVRVIAAADTGSRGRLVSPQNGKIITCEDVRRIVNAMLFEHQCFCRDVIVSCGEQTADPHERGHGPLYANAPIVMDIFPQHLEHGYWGDLTRTVVRGRATPELKKMYLAVRAAQAAALNMIKPGIMCRTVHNAAAGEMVARGFKTGIVNGKPEGFIHSTGHGVGLSIHEAPTLGGSDVRLRAGHVVTVEPGLYYPGLGGVRIEDTVVVTSGGWRYLSPCEKRLEI